MPKLMVGIVMGSDSDMPTMVEAANVLAGFGVPYELRIASAHRSPAGTRLYARSAEKRGLRVIIAGAGGSAHLAGVIASQTTIPVIGVPMVTRFFRGVDSFLSTLQMPEGVPVATMAVGTAGARNAALLAVSILAIHDKQLREQLRRYRTRLARSVAKKDNAIRRAR